ncbi:MAG: ABC transporter substrate-binding protein [Planctomycetota bacterium]|nr:ABC transporter substrate-binding protein [Planctomycetota bacterium]
MIEASKNRLIGSLTRRAALVCAGALACGAVLAGFAPVPAADPIKVGHYGSMTGSEATFGQSTDRGIRLAIDEINAAGGVNGRLIELITYDTKGDSGEAGKAVTRLISSDKVAAVLGEVASSLSLAGGAVCQQYGVPMITPSSTNPRVTMGRDFVFRVCFTDDFQAFALAKFVKENLKFTKVAILWDQKQAYSKGLRDEFTKSFTKMSGQIVIDQAYSGGDQDFSAQLAAIATANAEILLVPGYYTDGAAIALQARKKGIKVPLLGGDGWDSEQLGKIAGDAIAGSYYSNHSAPDQPEMQEFVNKFKKKYDGQTPDALTGLGYDAAYLLADAFKKAKSLGGKDVRDVLAQAKDFPGVTGAITMDKNRNASKAAVIVQMTKNDKGEVLPKYVASVAPDKDAAKK